MSLLQPDQIAVVNVRPAYDTSLAMGVSVDDLASLGLPRAVMEDPDGAVSGQATYAHFEHMARRPDYPDFVLGAVERHTFGTLGVVGLACKTLDTIVEALECHQRFQHLTNQTARYVPLVEEGLLVFREERWGEPRPGLLLVSEYTALVALQLRRSRQRCRSQRWACAPGARRCAPPCGRRSRAFCRHLSRSGPTTPRSSSTSVCSGCWCSRRTRSSPGTSGRAWTGRPSSTRASPSSCIACGSASSRPSPPVVPPPTGWRATSP
ncbi:MAG: AraC family transcriptional regulator ligand-binding domain-containing protein [Myxococcales bacterium]|nr:AraC family transcriptional regulator ligand-binding domain-containing protein [Myxococcales bacterium]